MEQEQQKITLLSKKDLEISWFSGGPGSGGQYRNKHDNCCRIYHLESGARAQGTEERSRAQNLRKAFKRLVETPKMKFWLARKLYELSQQETLEETIEKSLVPENLKFEVKKDGKWIEVGCEYFDTEEARIENHK